MGDYAREPSGTDAPERLALADHGRDQIAAEVVRQVPPVRCVEEDEVGLIARRETANQPGAVEDVRPIDG